MPEVLVTLEVEIGRFVQGQLFWENKVPKIQSQQEKVRHGGTHLSSQLLSKA
jgi:hypothetical protein